jgi:predicted N-acetyltransferase YhbS
MSPKKALLGHRVEVLELIEPDIEKLMPILIEHVKDRNTHEVLWDEISDIKSYMKGKKDNNDRTRRYLVAKDETGKVWGCMAYSTPDPDMIKHFNISKVDDAAELLNAFVSSEVFRGGGIGKRIFEAICNDAKERGKRVLVIHSGPRYKKSWGFYDKMCGENHGFILVKYGKGGDAMTWQLKLVFT